MYNEYQKRKRKGSEETFEVIITEKFSELMTYTKQNKY